MLTAALKRGTLPAQAVQVFFQPTFPETASPVAGSPIDPVRAVVLPAFFASHGPDLQSM
jgi:hypothetical protein